MLCIMRYMNVKIRVFAKLMTRLQVEEVSGCRIFENFFADDRQTDDRQKVLLYPLHMCAR